MGYKAVAINAGCLKIKEIDAYHNQSNITISSSLKVIGNVNIDGAVTLGSTVQSQSEVKDTLEVKGGATLNGNLNLAGNLNIGGPAGSYNNSVLVVKHPYLDSTPNAKSRVGINTDAPRCILDVNGVDAIKIPVGTTNDRPTPVTGMIRYNTDLSLYEGYGGTAWGSLGGAIDIDQDTDINTDTYFEGTPVGDKDDDIIRLRNRNLQTMIIDHTGKVGIGDESHFHPAVPESEIRDAWVLDKIVKDQTGLNVDNKTPSAGEYKNIYEGKKANGDSTTDYNAFSASYDNLETWATLNPAKFVGYVVKANPTIGIPDEIHYEQKTTNADYANAEEFISKLPQSSLDVRGNVSVSQNLNVNGYVMIPIDQKLYLTENKENYLTVKSSSDDQNSTANLEIKSTEGDINLFTGGNINIPTNVKLNFGNNNELLDQSNNFNVSTSNNLTFTNENHTINSSGNNSIVANASKIQLNSSSTAADSLHLNSTNGNIILDTPNTQNVAVNTGNFTVTSSNNTTLTSSNNVLIKSTTSETTNSIKLESTSGSVLLKSSKKMNLTSGQINLTSNENTSNAIQIVTDGGTSETLLIKNTQGTHDDDAIKIESAAGGVKLQSQKNIDIESETKNIEFRVKDAASKFVFKNDANELINIEQNGRVQFLNTDEATVTNDDHKNVAKQSFTVTDAPFNVNGSAHISKNIFVNESVYINGNLNVKGDITQINTDQLVVDDPLIVLGLNQTTSNREHSGIMNRYKDASDVNKFTGLVRVPGASLETWATQVETPTSQSGSFHLFTDTVSVSGDANHPNIQDSNYDEQTQHSDLHLRNIMLLGTGDVENTDTGKQYKAALQVKGGACIGEKLHIGSTIAASENGSNVRGNNASLMVQGGISLAENIYMNQDKLIQWSDGEHITASGTELKLTGHKICLKTDDGGDHDTSGNIRFKYNEVEAYSFDNDGRVKSNQNFVLDVDGNINLDVPDNSKKVLFSCNETNFLSINNNDSNSTVISNESNGSIDIQHSNSTIMSFKANKVELTEGSQLKFNANNYITNDSSILKFNYNTLNFVNSTNILELSATSATLQKPLYLGDNTNSINIDTNKLVLNSNTGIDYKINNTTVCDINGSTFNVNQTIKFDTAEIFESNNALNIKTNTGGTVKLNTTNVKILQDSKLILGNKNNYITNNGTDLNIKSNQSNLTLSSTKKIIMNSSSNIELSAGLSSRGVVKVTNTTDDALTVEGGVNVAQDVVVQGELQSHGPLQLNHNLYYVPEIINYSDNNSTSAGTGVSNYAVDGQVNDGHDVTIESTTAKISSNTVLTVININSTMSDSFYLELGNGSYNGQIKKLVLHPNYQQNKDSDTNVVNVDIDKFCDPDGNRIDDATIILNRGGQSVNLIWVMDDDGTNDGYYLLLDNNFDFN